MNKIYLYGGLALVLVLLLISLFLGGQKTNLPNFQAYFETYLSSGDETREGYRVFEVPEGFDRVKFEGEFVGIDFEAFSHYVYILAEADWYTSGVQDFYLELERPSACYSQVLFGVVEEDECEEKMTSEFFGPFRDNLPELITAEAVSTVAAGE